MNASINNLADFSQLAQASYVYASQDWLDGNNTIHFSMVLADMSAL